MKNNTEIPGKTTAIIAYITIVGAIIAVFMNSDPKHEFARYHTRQAFGLHIIFHGFGIFSSVWFNQYGFYALYLCYIVLWVYGFTGALNNKKQEVPILGPYFQKWFTFIS